MKRFPWLRALDKKSRREVPYRPPIWLKNRSNGEFFHPQTNKERLAERIILEEGERQARRLGMDRREFMISTAGMALSLSVLNLVSGCTNQRMTGGKGGDAGGGGGDGGYQPPPIDECVERGGEALAGNEFIFDIQTHHFDPTAPWRNTNQGYVTYLGLIAALYGVCSDSDPINCYTRERYAETIFLNSDTTVAVLSSWPAQDCNSTTTTDCGLPLPNTSIVATRDWLNDMAMSQRLVNHCQIMPNLNIDEQLAVMEQMKDQYGVSGWKLYPAWRPTNGQGFWMDDPVGIKTIEKGRELGVKVFCIHKGLPIPGFDIDHNYPWDVPRVAKVYPDCRFVVYHSAICAGQGLLVPIGIPQEGPYDSTTPQASLGGIDTLIRALENAGVGPNENVYAELGSCWSNVMNDPTMAQHAIGKLLKYVGEDNVVWGTDSLVGPNPQSQIEAFRTFQISSQLQSQYGYPALTPELKAKIFGLNAATIFGIDPNAERCKVQANQIQTARLEIDQELGGRRWAIQAPMGPHTRREFFRMARWQREQGRPG